MDAQLRQLGPPCHLAVAALSMAGSLYSPSWYRVAELRPRLRAHVQIHRQRFRGDIWYIVQDHQSGQFHRLSPAAHRAVCLMDGRRTVEAIWLHLSERLGEDQPTQEEIVSLLARLHAADALIGGVSPHMEEVSERAEKHERQQVMARLRNPLALRLPLFDPDRFLALTLPLVRPIFSVWGLLIWLGLVGTGIFLAAVNWAGLTNNLSDHVLSAQNLVLLLLTYPVIKALHECGHAYATKIWGGAVHEVGLMLLVFVPVPYVDASSSIAFREKWRRMVVGGAGIMVEAALAAIAVIVWNLVEPGIVRAIAFNVAAIAGVSTLFFNGNPLLRFDGYYVLSDLIEIPNLGGRANRYFFYLIQRYGMGLDEAENPVTGRGEGPWFFLYAVASFFYRISITFTIALLVASKFFFFGVALALFSFVTAVVLPLWKGLKFLLVAPALKRRRKRALVLSLGTLAALCLGLLWLPAPYATSTQGVVWIGDEATIRAATDGIVAAVDVANDQMVEANAVLITVEDQIQSAAASVLEHQRDELTLKLQAQKLSDVVQANLLREEIRHLDGQIAQARQDIAELSVVAPHAGRILISGPEDMPGRFVHKGEVLAYLLGPQDPVVRVVVPQDSVDLIRRQTSAIAVRFAEHLDQPVAATMLRNTPSAQDELPHLALATTGGGPIVLDPNRTDRPHPLETVFQFDLQVAGPVPLRLGERVHVLFEHPPEPLAYRLGRAARQLFLRQFGV